ncbi:MAG TPA: heavy metal translocating P-type ATPase, partial [Chloroflexaceae bacterium]|nr:heavy metal translocating P-type ATPase [Chloroflexaceae bacterium]
MSTFTQTQTSPRAPARHLLRDELLEPLFVALTLVGIVAGAVLGRLGAAPGLLLAVHSATYVTGGFYAVRAIVAALRERTVEVDLLMVLAALGAAYVGAWTEGAILLFLFSLSNLLQNFAMDRTRQAISALLELRPDTVAVRRGDALVELPVEEVRPGDVVALRPGD